MANDTPPGTNKVPVQLYTVAEACQLLKISRSSLYKRFSEGKLAARKVGGSTRIRSDELSTYMRDLKCVQASEEGGW